MPGRSSAAVSADAMSPRGRALSAFTYLPPSMAELRSQDAIQFRGEAVAQGARYDDSAKRGIARPSGVARTKTLYQMSLQRQPRHLEWRDETKLRAPFEHIRPSKSRPAMGVFTAPSTFPRRPLRKTPRRAERARRRFQARRRARARTSRYGQRAIGKLAAPSPERLALAPENCEVQRL